MAAQSQTLFAEPIFGMIYDTRSVHFETAPDRLGQRCGLLRGKQWLYAYWKEEDTEFFVVNNKTSWLTGVGLVLRGSSCTEGTAEWVLSGEPDTWKDHKSVKFTEAVSLGLAKDLLRRYEAAFGGKKKFLEAVKPVGPPGEQMPVLQREFERFSTSP